VKQSAWHSKYPAEVKAEDYSNAVLSHFRAQNYARAAELFEELLSTVNYASLGQITNLLYEVGGKYRRNM
jgi:methylmalonyl-CoA mutase